LGGRVWLVFELVTPRAGPSDDRSGRQVMVDVSSSGLQDRSSPSQVYSMAEEVRIRPVPRGGFIFVGPVWARRPPTPRLRSRNGQAKDGPAKRFRREMGLRPQACHGPPCTPRKNSRGPRCAGESKGGGSGGRREFELEEPGVVTIRGNIVVDTILSATKKASGRTRTNGPAVFYPFARIRPAQAKTDWRPR